MNQYNIISKLLHWLSAIAIILLFILGKWMMGLDYYSPYYHPAPEWHKAIGMLLIAVILLRIIWRKVTGVPAPIRSHSQLIQKSSHLGHMLLYVLMLASLLSGYLLAGTDGEAIELLNGFAVPVLGEFFENQEDILGELHELLTLALIILASLHALAAIKHHVIDKDETLKRML